MFDAKKYLNETEQLYVVFAHEEKGKLYIPFIGIDGRMEFLSTLQQAENVVKELKDKLKVNTYVKQLTGRENIMNFFLYCRHNGLNLIRINNGTSEMQDVSLNDIIDNKENSIIEYLSRSIRNKLIRSKLYEKNLFEFPEADKTGALSSRFSELMYTMRFNAYREMFCGVFYVLSMKQMPEGREYYTAAALNKVKEILKSKTAASEGYDASSLTHGNNTFAEEIKEFPELFFFNVPGQAGIENGFVSIFTDYAAAQHGMNAIVEAGADKGSILTVTMSEIMEKTQDYAGIVVDMNSINYIITKKDYETIEKCGNYKEPVVVRLNQNK